MKPNLILLGMNLPAQEAMQFAAAGTWGGDDEFAVTMHYLETPHREYLTFSFSEDTLTLTVRNSMVDPQNPMFAQLETEFSGKVG